MFWTLVGEDSMEIPMTGLYPPRGAEMYRHLFALLEDEPIHRAYAGITLPNPASLALHRQFGFRYVGLYDEVGFKLGMYWSVQWLEKPMPFLDHPVQ